MRRLLISNILIFLAPVLFAQEQDFLLIDEIKNFQIELDDHYHNKKESPLTRKERKHFKGHSFYPIDLNYRVEARFERINRVDTVILATSSGKIKYYQPYAKVIFTIDDKQCELIVYQSLRLRSMEAYKNHLLLPFRDVTSGNTSYGGGRYLDLEIPSGDVIILNFNLAYNPYCAYTDGYNCTIPPAENTLEIPILAGVRAPLNAH